METWEGSAFPNGRDSKDSCVQLLVWHVSNRDREGPCHCLLNSEGLGSRQSSTTSGFRVLHCKNLKNKILWTTRRKNEFYYGTDHRKRKHTEAHTEGEGTKRGLPLCLGVNKALLVEAWEGELWGPVHEASILPSNPVFGSGLQGRPHSEVPNQPCVASRQLCSVGCCVKRRQGNERSEQEPGPKYLWHLWPLARQNYS